MRSKYLYILMALLGAMTTSCADEAEELMLLQQEPKIDMTPGEALRSVKPKPTGQSPGTMTQDGEKGHDRRDVPEDYVDKEVKFGSITQMEPGFLYVTGYDPVAREYSLQFYWGDELSEHDRDIVNFNRYLCIRFVREGHGLLGYTYSTSFYRQGDVIKMPDEICWTCTQLEINFQYFPQSRYRNKPCTYSLSETWYQPFESLWVLGVKNIAEGKRR